MRASWRHGGLEGERRGGRGAGRGPGRFGRLAVLWCLPAALLASCGPTFQDVSAPAGLPAAFSAGGEAQMPARWWTVLGDATLDGLIEEALRGNLGLRGAWDRLAQADATARRSGAGRLPSLTGTAGASGTRTKTAGPDPTYANSFSLGLAAGYELDLWGRVRSVHEGALLDALASREDLHAAAMTLTAELAAAWYHLVEQRGQLELLDEQIKTNADFLAIVTAKFDRGQVSATDVLQQRQLLEATRGDRARVAGTVSVLEHLAAILLGRAPGTYRPPAGQRLPALPALPAAGLPAEWIRRRPDIRAAQLRVQAADRRTAAAIAERFPTVSLSAQASTTAEEVRDLFDNWLATMAANLTAPLFDAGLRRAEVDRTRAAAAESFHRYGQTVLAALKEVEDGLSEEAHQREYVSSLARQVELSRKSVDQTRDKYAKGAGDFLRFLTALQSHQRLQRTQLQARRELVQFRISLYRALGGSWALPAPPGVPTRLTGPMGGLLDGAQPVPAAGAR